MVIKMYVCYNCGKELEPSDIKKRVRCPYCGSKLLFKKSPDTVREVDAR
ncbi:MAG TPA: DNA-directed RNA polymerase subunit P [Candidatus Aenigmarchaeota archaeon]|nr:MAG: DNA-directed RNA polymerase subunit P [Nanoarchaeota archaeon]HDO79994.1 DNA-directed RNA polymerase subunit P [Candidatus Aenigmarchaeota archaeon]HEX33046.1 DNA-directed RNA polymerase subunit P [Candidatus Aenigmarchaeota archaeon]